MASLLQTDLLCHPSSSSDALMFGAACRFWPPTRRSCFTVVAHCSSSLDPNYLLADHHATLGVSSGASKLEIKRAYRRLARQFHPDVCKDRCSEQWFKHINHAYESLMNHSAQSSSDRVRRRSASFCSEAGYGSVEDLLRCCEGSYWASAPSASWKWVQEQESVDASVFTAEAAATPDEEMEIAWLRW